MREFLKTLGAIGEDWFLAINEFFSEDRQLKVLLIVGFVLLDVVLFILFVNTGNVGMRDALFLINLIAGIVMAVTGGILGFLAGAVKDVFDKNQINDAKAAAGFITKAGLFFVVVFAVLHAFAVIFPAKNLPIGWWSALICFLGAIGVGFLRGFKSDVPWRVVIALCVSAGTLEAIGVLNPGIPVAVDHTLPHVKEAQVKAVVHGMNIYADIWRDPLFGVCFVGLVVGVLFLFFLASFRPSGTSKGGK